MIIDLGERSVLIGYEGPDGAVRNPVYKTVRARLEIDIDALSRILVPKAARTKRGRSHIGGGMVVARVVRT